MRFMQLASQEGTVYVNVQAIDAVSPRIVEKYYDHNVMTRTLYLRGGQILEILDTPENMSKLVESPEAT